MRVPESSRVTREDDIISVDSATILSLRKTARSVALIDRDRISEEDLRDLNNYRSSKIIRRPRLSLLGSEQSSGDSRRAGSRKHRRATLYPVLLEARKALLQTACLYEHKEYRPVYPRALADTAESVMQRLASEGDFMREIFLQAAAAEPAPLVAGALETFQTEIEERLDEIREELEEETARHVSNYYSYHG